ncbi:MAG: HAMP domain-containing sensor histidine kinase, partial [Thermodesulfobacteriota bacterium]
PEVIGVISNLISNAIDSMPDGGSLTIATQKEMFKDTPYLNVTITDTGAGIPEDKLSMLFEPFFTTKVLGRGTGLGLPICKRTVENHGGFINFESELGKGSTFSLYFPYKNKDFTL